MSMSTNLGVRHKGDERISARFAQSLWSYANLNLNSLNESEMSSGTPGTEGINKRAWGRNVRKEGDS